MLLQRGARAARHDGLLPGTPARPQLKPPSIDALVDRVLACEGDATHWSLKDRFVLACELLDGFQAAGEAALGAARVLQSCWVIPGAREPRLMPPPSPASATPHLPAAALRALLHACGCRLPPALQAPRACPSCSPGCG